MTALISLFLPKYRTPDISKIRTILDNDFPSEIAVCNYFIIRGFIQGQEVDGRPKCRFDLLETDESFILLGHTKTK